MQKNFELDRAEAITVRYAIKLANDYRKSYIERGYPDIWEDCSSLVNVMNELDDKLYDYLYEQ